MLVADSDRLARIETLSLHIGIGRALHMIAPHPGLRRATEIIRNFSVFCSPVQDANDISMGFAIHHEVEASSLGVSFTPDSRA